MFEELGDILMFFGSSELFFIDGLRMQRIAEEGELNISFRFYDEMPHDWIIFPIPEATYAIQEACEFMQG